MLELQVQFFHQGTPVGQKILDFALNIAGVEQVARRTYFCGQNRHIGSD